MFARIANIQTSAPTGRKRRRSRVWAGKKCITFVNCFLLRNNVSDFVQVGKLCFQAHIFYRIETTFSHVSSIFSVFFS